MSLQALADEIIEEMRRLVKDVHKIPSKQVEMNKHAYRIAVLVDLSNILVKILPYCLSGSEQKYRLMSVKSG